MSELNFSVCANCGLAFEDYIGTAKVCHRCKDIVQQRPSIVESRKRLAFWEGVKVEGLPGSWQFFQAMPKDDPVYRIDVRGKQFGADWSGRIVIYAPRPIEHGEIVNVRLMEAEHLVRVVGRERRTLHHGTVSVTETIPVYQDEYGELATEAHRYMVIEPADEPAELKLIWAWAHTKTTLKGLGRQYAQETIIVPEPMYATEIRGGMRSGRAFKVGTLAICAIDAKVEVVERDLSRVSAS